MGTVIPDARSIKREIPKPDTRIIRTDTRYAGAGLETASKLASDFAERASKHEASKAETDFLIKKSEFDISAKQDNEYDTLPDRYNATLTEELGKISSTISDPMLREEFMNRGKVLIEQGRAKTTDIAWGKEKDFERGQLDEKLSLIRDNTLKSDGDIAETNLTAMALIDASADMGYISEQEKVKTKTEFRHNMAIGKLEMMEPEARVDALGQPWAKNLPADVHAKLLRDAKEKTLAGKAQRTVDGYMDNNLTRDEAMENTSKIKDPKERAETERRFDYAFGKRKEAIVEKQSAIFDEHFLGVRSGEKTVGDIPRDELEALTPAQQNSLFSAQSSSVKTPRKYSDRPTIDTLNVLYETKQFTKLRQTFMESAHLLDDSDFESWSKISVKGVVPVEVKSLFTAQQYMGTKLKEVGVTSDASKGAFHTKLNEWYQDYQTQNNKLPTDAERDKQVDRMLLEFDTTWTWGGSKRIFEMNDEERNYAMKDVKDENPELFNDVTAYFAANKINPSYEQFMEAFSRLKEQRDAAE